MSSLITWLLPEPGLPNINMAKDGNNICYVPGVNYTPSTNV